MKYLILLTLTVTILSCSEDSNSPRNAMVGEWYITYAERSNAGYNSNEMSLCMVGEDLFSFKVSEDMKYNYKKTCEYDYEGVSSQIEYTSSDSIIYFHDPVQMDDGYYRVKLLRGSFEDGFIGVRFKFFGPYNIYVEYRKQCN